MKYWLYCLISVVFVFGGIFIGGDISFFLDLPSFIITFFLTTGCMLSKHGQNFFKIASLDSRTKHKIALDGIFISILSGIMGTSLGIINMMGNLADQGSIGPALAVSFITTFYGFFIASLFIPLLDFNRITND